MTDRLLTTRELAELLGLSPATILRRHRLGDLPGYRLASNVLRFRASEIEAWLGARHQGDLHLSHTLTQGSHLSNLGAVTESDATEDDFGAEKGSPD